MEMFITAALVLTVLMLAAESKSLRSHQNYTFKADETPPGLALESRFTPFAPLGFGFTLFVLELFAVEYTGGAVK